MPRLFWKSDCSPCREVRAVVRDLAPEVDERNYAKEPLTEAEILELVRICGGVGEVLATRSPAAKALGWTEAPDEATFAAAAARDNNLVRRPILVAGDAVVIGRRLADVRAALTR